jgi:serine/threonine-protein kinase
VAILEAEGLEVNQTFEERDDADPDIVFAQDPDPGTDVDKGDTVTIVVSQGSDAVALPNVVGLQQADAVAQLQGLNMEAVIVEIDTQDQPEGTVLAQDPAPGEEVPEGTRVTLQVVGPAATIAVPDVTGQDQLSAAATLGRNFQVATEQEGSDTVAVGAVIRTDPPAGTMVPRDSLVTMFISAGSPITTVPDVVGLTQSAASDRLTNAGLIMEVQFVNLSSDDSRIGIVITQDPEGGVKADIGLTVTVVVGQAIGGGSTTTTFPNGGSTSILFPPIT